MSQSYKVVIIGDSAVGKTSILDRYAKGTFKKDLDPTIGAHFISRMLDVPSGTLKLQIWDTAGQEKFRGVTSMYFRDAAAAILVYDITNKETFDNCQYWINELRNQAPDDIILGVAANKSDLYDKEEVSLEEGKQFVTKNKLDVFASTSAKEDHGITELFGKIAAKIDKLREEVKIRNRNIQLDMSKNEEKDIKKKKKCCKSQ